MHFLCNRQTINLSNDILCPITDLSTFSAFGAIETDPIGYYHE